jgi:kumamolisin
MFRSRSTRPTFRVEACPTYPGTPTGDRISDRVDGKDAVFGGTSAVAPLWAALIALLSQRLGRSLGYLNPALYTSPVDPAAFRDITAGTNGAYSAAPGWDACTGLGSPNGAALLTALSGRVRTH